MTSLKDKLVPIIERANSAATTTNTNTNTNTNNEWTITIKNYEKEWTIADFNKAIRGLRTIQHVQETVTKDCLEVAVSNSGIRLFVRELANISKYCYADSVTTLLTDQYTFYEQTVLQVDTVADVLSLPIVSTVQSKKQLSLSVALTDLKTHTLRKTITFDNSDEGIQYNVSMVRTDNKAAKTFKESCVSSAPVTFEFSMTVNITDQSVTSEQIISNIVQFIQAIRNEPMFLSTEQKAAIIDSYVNLTKDAFDPKIASSLVSKREKPIFLAPKPVTLERHHLQEAGTSYGVITILSGYAVTDKADGERVLLFIDKLGGAYVIFSNLSVMATGLRVNSPSLHNSLIDGELIDMSTSSSASSSCWLFAAFDLYYVNGRSFMDQKLFPTRNDKMVSVMNKANWSAIEGTWMYATFDIKAKVHIAAENDEMYRACSQILSEKKDYMIDGLVFTPTNLAVWAYYPNIAVKVGRGSKWNRVFKWKPPEQNTIDFLVEEGEPVIEKVDGTLTKYRQFSLMTGFNMSQLSTITPTVGLDVRYSKKYRDSDEYVGRIFNPVPAFEQNIGQCLIDAKKCVTAEGEPISGGLIIEFSYDVEAELRKTKQVGHRWTPLRIRHDKTAIYRNTKSVSGCANDYSTALNIWRSIHFPVSRDAITGDFKALSIIEQENAAKLMEERIPGAEDLYYDRQVPRMFSLSLPMLNFHNLVMKRYIYSKYRGRSLLELACGKAGDAPRWRDAGFRFVLGIDINRDNIVNSNDGAYARMLRQVKMMPEHSYFDAAFVVGDVKKPLRGGVAGDDGESKNLLKAVLSGNRSRAHYLSQVTGQVQNGQFDLVSIQFAIHYFFDSEENLNGLLSNVQNHLRKGGHFACTFMDGSLVNNILSDPSNAGKAEGVVNDTVIWALLKMYDTYSANEKEAFGKKINVYLEMTRQLIPEYLVNYELLCKKCADYGLEVVESETFDQKYNEHFANQQQNSNRPSTARPLPPPHNPQPSPSQVQGQTQGQTTVNDGKDGKDEKMGGGPNPKRAYSARPAFLEPMTSNAQRTFSFLNRFAIFKKL